MTIADASAPSTLRLLVVNQGDRTMSVVDPVALKTVGTVDEEQTTMHAHEVATSPDGRTAYLPVYGNVGVGKPGLDGNEILAVDLPSGKITGRVRFSHGVRPHCPVYDRVNHLLYVTTELDNTVTVIDPKTMKIVATVPTGAAQSHMLALSPDGGRGYTANVEPGSVSVLDLHGRRTLKVIPISAKTQRIALSRDGRWAFTSDQTQPRMAVIDTRTQTVARWIALPGLGYGSAATADGKWLLVPMWTGRSVAVVNLATMHVDRTVDVLPAPQEVLLSPDGRFAYVASPPENKVSVIDLAQWKMTGSIAVGAHPDGLAWARW